MIEITAPDGVTKRYFAVAAIELIEPITDESPGVTLVYTTDGDAWPSVETAEQIIDKMDKWLVAQNPLALFQQAIETQARHIDRLYERINNTRTAHDDLEKRLLRLEKLAYGGKE